MKIGLLTIHAAHNYGAMLQAYATQKILEKLGHEVQIINYLHEESSTKIPSVTNFKAFLLFFYAKFSFQAIKRRINFENFTVYFNLTKRFRFPEELYKEKFDYDAIIVGSDQVWNLQSQKVKPIFFLDFVGENIRRISFSSSFGTSQIPENLKNEVGLLFKKFDYISVREKDGVDIIFESSGRQATHVLDPTLLLAPSDWLTIQNPIGKYDEFILVYGLDSSKASQEIIDKLKLKINLPVVFLSFGVITKLKVDEKIIDAGPKEFIYLFNKATFICTNSFHGVCFSINFRKSFFSIKHPTRNSRMESLLGLLDLGNRQISGSQDIDNFQDTNLEIDYSDKNDTMNSGIESSLNFLKQALN